MKVKILRQISIKTTITPGDTPAKQIFSIIEYPIQVLDWDGTVLWEREGKKYLVGIVEESGVSSIEDIINLDKNPKKIMDIHPVSAEKAERIKKIIEEE